jgi:hypothetical protein
VLLAPPFNSTLEELELAAELLHAAVRSAIGQTKSR